MVERFIGGSLRCAPRIGRVAITCAAFFIARAAFSDAADAGPSADERAQWGPCEREEFVEVIHKAWHECGREDSIQTSDCRAFRDHLAGLADPSPEQHRALAIGYATAAIFEADETLREELHQRSLAIMRGLVRDHPDDPRWTYALGLMEEEEGQKVALLKRTLDLDPTCITAAEVLAGTLAEGWDRSESDRAEGRGYMLQAYERATGNNKLYYARGYMEQIEHTYQKPMEAYALNGEMVAEKRAFRSRVIADLALDTLAFDEENRAESLDLLCDGLVLEIGIEGLCLEAMAVLVDHDRRAGRPIGDDVLRAIEMFATKILNHSPFSHSGHLIDQGFGAGARYLMYMRDVLDAEPEDRRGSAYYEAYASMTSMAHRVGVLRRALELDPANGRIGFNLAESYMELERYEEAEEAYRYVIDHDDRRTRHDSGTSFSAMANERLERVMSLLSGDGG